MQARLFVSIVIAGMALVFASASWADVPAPPVNQVIGMDDVVFSALTEPDCRVCHDSGVRERHDLLDSQPIPAGSLVPYPDVDGNSIPDTIYACENCHGPGFDPSSSVVERDCTVCHNTESPHHTTPTAQSGDCVSCHGDVVDNMDDGHYIPMYGTSLVTPWPSSKPNSGDTANSLGDGAGNCDYCHERDDLSAPTIYKISDLHHSTGLFDSTQCMWCHDTHSTAGESIRACQRCHGPDSLHNIQADSPNSNNIGTLVVGGEDAGYGHVGRDAGPGDSDCWGCHGFSFLDLPPVPDNEPDRHHVLYGQPVSSPTEAPFATPGGIYVCLSCHGTNFTVVRDCQVCHPTSVDSDGDGVPDNVDSCPAEDATGFDVDGDGCLDDTDGDGVTDDVDFCPAEDATGFDVDGDGCLDDSDGDGVTDNVDSCPAEDATGFDVDGDGCVDNTSGLGDSLDILVQEGVVAEEIQSALMAKIENAEKSVGKNNICAAINQLTAFKNQVNAQRGIKISDEVADDILAYADSVIGHLLSQLPPGESC